MSRPPTGSSDLPFDPKTEPARPHNSDQGLTQYAEVAARFHAEMVQLSHYSLADAARRSFDHADAFFAELAKRTTP